MQEDEYTVADEALQGADAGVDADTHEPEEEPDQPAPAPVQPDASHEDDEVQYVGGTASDKDSVDSDPTRGLDPVAVDRVIDLVSFLTPHLTDINMEQAPATFQRTFPDVLRRHLRQGGVLEYFEEVAERPQEHAAAGVIRELFPDGESDLIFRALSYLRLPPLPARDSRTSSGRAVRPPTSLFDPDYHLNLPQQQVSGKPRKPKREDTEAEATPSKVDAPDTEAQAKPVAPTPTDATPSKGYVKMKARKTIEAERAALLASQPPPQPHAEDKTPTCSVCGNPVNLFSPDGIPFTCCSQCVRTSTGAPIKRKRPETDPPQELKKRRDPDEDGDGPPQGPASSQGGASAPQTSAAPQHAASAPDTSTGPVPTSTSAQDVLAVGLRHVPSSTPFLFTAFPS